jgi:hypothetical protein
VRRACAGIGEGRSGAHLRGVSMWIYLSVGWGCCSSDATTIAEEITKHKLMKLWMTLATRNTVIEYGEHVFGSGKGARGPIFLVSRCGDICPLGGVVAAQMPLRSQRR